MNCNEMFNAGICYVTDAYKTVCKFNEELHADLEKYRDENAKLRELVRKVEHYEQYGCYECPYADSCDVGTLYDVDCAMSREIERKKHELGIEVDV